MQRIIDEPKRIVTNLPDVKKWSLVMEAGSYWLHEYAFEYCTLKQISVVKFKLSSNPTIISEQDLRLLWPSFKLVSLISTCLWYLVLGHPCKYGLLRPSTHNHSLKRGFVWQ